MWSITPGEKKKTDKQTRILVKTFEKVFKRTVHHGGTRVRV